MRCPVPTRVLMTSDIAPRVRFTDEELIGIKDRNPVDAVAGQWVALRSRRRDAYVGPCPMCSGDPRSKTAMRFECDADKWVCAVCQDGGDVIKLMQKREGIGFAMAVERLGGVREEVITPAIAKRRGALDYRRDALPAADPIAFPAGYVDEALRVAYVAGWRESMRKDGYANAARERERKRLYDAFWTRGVWFQSTPVERYLAARGLVLPDNARIKYIADMPMFADGRERDPLLVHRGPAMLAALIDAAGTFRGLHITWLDPHGYKGKAAIINPGTGEVLPSKKMRGTKLGTYIDLGGVGNPERMIAGEGIETVGAVYTALVRARRDVSRTAFRASGDLGNLAGRALNTIAHPTLKSAAGRAQRVPGPDPDLNSIAMPMSDSVKTLVLLGDGDSDPFLTRNATERARRRHFREGREVRVRFAPDGKDFDDLIKNHSATAEDQPREEETTMTTNTPPYDDIASLIESSDSDLADAPAPRAWGGPHGE